MSGCGGGTSGGPGSLGLALKHAFQLAYVAMDGQAAGETLQRTLDVAPFDHSSGTLDVLDANGVVRPTPIDVWFGLDKSIEIIQPHSDPCGLFDLPGLAGGELRFHHVATWLPELGPYLAAARARSVPVIRTRTPGVAFVDLRATSGHWLELLDVAILDRAPPPGGSWWRRAPADLERGRLSLHGR